MSKKAQRKPETAPNASGKKKNVRSQKKKKAIKIIAILDAILLLGVVALLFVINYNSFEQDAEVPTQFVDETGNADDGSDQHAVSTLKELRDCSDLSSILKEWAQTGDEDTYMQDKKVINVLLIGVDEGGGNSDVLMLASLNKKTEKIYLTSIMRDSYTYISTAFGDRYSKINAAYANGGAECLVQTIQNDFKIKIDNYVSVSYQSFSKIVDAMGGIDLPVQRYEAYETGVIWEWGDNVHLNGAQALEFCRIRNCDADGDVSRTRRQRTFINAVIQKTKTVSVSQLSEILSTLLQYVKTDYTMTQLVSMGTQALTNKWYNYEIVQTTMPLEECRMDYSGYSWVWIVDYPACAKELQEIIYGESNIELNSDRLTAIDAMKNGQTGEYRP